jgi:hypothetical protein
MLVERAVAAGVFCRAIIAGLHRSPTLLVCCCRNTITATTTITATATITVTTTAATTTTTATV